VLAVPSKRTSLPARKARSAAIARERPRSGYKVVFVPFNDGRPSGEPLDVLTGFIGSNDKAQGRPVGVAMHHEGALLVAADVGNTIRRITPAAPKSALVK
jgi:glucose/arabinose dehydrogenase